MAHIISVIQTKGGTGKTTTAMMLSCALTALGSKVMVLDADHQRSATDWAEDAGDALGFTVHAAPTERTLETAIRRYDAENLDFLLVDTPPGSNSIVRTASSLADLVLIPTGVSPLDMRRTQATLDSFNGTDVPLAIVLTNVDKREKNSWIWPRTHCRSMLEQRLLTPSFLPGVLLGGQDRLFPAS
ncbi:AAA family ATPase [Corynebacterium mastitidis]